ncbi:MAG: HprK-related kinase A [Pseudomonadota bacterium]
MTTVSSLTRAQLGQRLANGGIDLQTGEFVTRLQTTISSVADGIGLLYADYPLRDTAEFADFHVRLVRPAGWRRWFKPQVLFLYDGLSAFRPLPLDHAFPMFEWGLNWCVSSRANTFLIIHAAVVERDGMAVVLPAPPGSGKSTLCAALVHHGWRLLSDELAMLRLDDGMLVPLPRPISLKNASIGIMRRYLDQPVFSREVSDTAKGTVAHLKPPADSIARAGVPARPAWVIFPKYVAGAPCALEPMPSAQAFMSVAENSFNYSLMGARGFNALGGMIDKSLCYRFSYSVLDEAIAAFSKLEPRSP